jgi:anti-sigma factor RsiW
LRCDEVKKLIADYSVDRLSEKVRRRIEDHLVACPDCAAELARQEKAMNLVEQMQMVEPPAGLWNGVYNRITSPQRSTQRQNWLFRCPRWALSLGLCMLVLASVVFLGIDRAGYQKETAVPDPAAAEYIRSHAAASRYDVFADHVGLSFVAAMQSSDEQEEL